MAKALKVIGGRRAVIRSTTERAHGVELDVAKALGGERLKVRLPRAPSPVRLLAVRGELARALRSTGGRPRISGTSRRQKIPLAEADWAQLEELAMRISGGGPQTTAGQVASVILHLALRDL